MERTENRIWQFDYIKALALACVIVLHISWTETQKQIPLFPYLINLAVPVFLIVSGYMNAMSCDRHCIDTIRQWFAPKIWLQRLAKILIPYTLLYFIEVIIHITFLREVTGSLTGMDILKIYVIGGWGPGAYYIPILVQVFLCFPFLYLLLKRHAGIGSISILLLQLLLEVGFRVLSIESRWYSVSLFRFLSCMLVGILFYQYREKISRAVVLAMASLGILYITAIAYMGYAPRLFPYWTDVSMPTTLLAGAFVYLAVHKMRRLPGRLDTVVLKIGQASFYIYLVQKVWYGAGFGEGLANKGIHVVINFIVCMFLGCKLFAVGQWVRKMIFMRGKL